MKTITPCRTTVTSFASPSLSQSNLQQGLEYEYEYDSGDYILSIASPPPLPTRHDPSPSHRHASSSSSCVAAALSDQSIVLYDSNSGRIAHRIEKAHDGPISELAFFPWEYRGLGTPPLLLSASRDGTIKVWDAHGPRPQRPALVMRLALPNEEALSASIGFGGTLVAAGTSAARVSFFDLRCADANGNDVRPSGHLMGSYVDAHTEEVTRVRFQSVSPPMSQSPAQAAESKTVLATASEDGLVAVHDPSRPSEDAALVSVLNIGAPTRDVGFFGPCFEGVYALTGSETMSVHHWDSAQTVSDVGGAGLRDLLSDAIDKALGRSKDDVSDGNAVEYLVGCTWAAVSTVPSAAGMTSALHLLAGNSDGNGYIFRMDADQIIPVIHLKGGHRGCIRDFCWVDSPLGKRLVTGGEDARLCEWDLSGGSAVGNSVKTPRDKTRGGGRISGRAMKGAGGSNGKGKKKFSSPY